MSTARITAGPSVVTSSRKPPFEVSGNPPVNAALSTPGRKLAEGRLTVCLDHSRNATMLTTVTLQKGPMRATRSVVISMRSQSFFVQLVPDDSFLTLCAPGLDMSRVCGRW